MEKALACILGILIASSAFALDAGDFGEVEGYTVITTTQVDGEFHGAEHDRPVILQNGMIFKFTEYSYSYSYSPDVVVFAQHHSADDLKKMGIRNPPVRGITNYKLLIDDEFYDAGRVR